MRNQEASIHNLENQISQLANLIFGRQQGSPSRNTELNLKEQVKVVTLRNGKQLPEREKLVKKEAMESQEKELDNKRTQPMKEYKPIVPYPA